MEDQKNENTKKKMRSDLRKWYEWCKTIRETRLIEDILPTELDQLLGHFYIKVKSNGSEYKPDSIYSFQRSLDRHLTKGHHKTYSIIQDAQFALSNKKLKTIRAEERGERQ